MSNSTAYVARHESKLANVVKKLDRAQTEMRLEPLNQNTYEKEQTRGSNHRRALKVVSTKKRVRFHDVYGEQRVQK
ncbi:hypothetical protein Aduo_018786 [Ancylostoma duodenale]